MSEAGQTHDAAPSADYQTVVLLVDDQAMVCEAIRRALFHQADMSFNYCGEATAAITTANQIKPTVILLDLVMPGIDGLTLISQFRANPLTQEVPIIVLSTSENPQVKGQAFALGANDYIIKLPDKIELVARIRYHSRAYLNQVQRDEAFRALRTSQDQLVETNANLIKLNRQLEEATLDKFRFLTRMGQDLRNLVNELVVVATRLLDTELSGEQRGFVEAIHRNADSLSATISHIVDFAKTEPGEPGRESVTIELPGTSRPSLDHTLAQRLPLRLLLADDNPINQKVGLNVLKKLGYDLDIVENGLQVLQALEQKTYDLIFLDVQMPELDGLETARRICQQWPPGKRPRLIAMTGTALAGDREKCLAAGMDDYISKPVRFDKLQAVLEKWGAMATGHAAAATVAPDDLLDQTILAELRAMPPEKGVSMLEELVQLFTRNAPQQIALLKKQLHDPGQLAFYAQSLKGMSLNLGAKKIVALAQQLEQMGQAGKLEGADKLVAELEPAFHLTKRALLSQHGRER
jgi:CheY-like chemotaxis protein/HPt (histidine-containing phosphotransfer) domain-containing protein